MNLQFSGRRNGFKKYIKSLDKILLLVVIVTLALSLFAINSATFQQEINGRCMLIQSGGILLGFVFMLLISKIDYDLISDLWPYIALATSVVLVVTAFIAPDINGNRNWIMLGPANVQPSEFGKLCFAVTFSAHLTKIGEQLNKIKNVLALCIHFALYFIPILLQGDIGTALVYFGMFLIIMFVAGLRYRYFIVGAALATAAVPFVWDQMKNYQRERILYGFQPELDPLGRGYQPLVSRMAIGSGQFWGLGYKNGIQAQNVMLPEIHTDFIYAIVGEESGFIGSLVVILLLLAIIILIIRDAFKAKDQKGSYICIMIASMIMWQSIINIGMCIGVLPVIGVTLPFFSYGGSSVMSMLMAIGLVQAVCTKPDRALKFGMR
mgnify:CR=1 FL=1